MNKVKKDVIAIIVIIAVILLFYVIPLILNGGHPGLVKVYRNGEEIGAYLLTEDRTVTVTDEDGGYNLLMISGGEAFVSDADCPDRLCVRQRRISRDGESIICLPHKLVIQIESKEKSTLDAVTN